MSRYPDDIARAKLSLTADSADRQSRSSVANHARDKAPSDDSLEALREDFEAIYHSHVDLIYKFAYARLGSRSAAEDATSQTFLKALNAFPSYRGGRVAAWLIVIARNVITDIRRSESPMTSSDTVELADTDPSPEESLVSRAQSKELRRLVSRLPDDQRLAIELQLAGHSLSETAAAMDRSVPAVKKLRARAVARLRRELSNNRKGGRT
jgi:RNA polymerase sigma-70 factor (ECF subfamily)